MMGEARGEQGGTREVFIYIVIYIVILYIYIHLYIYILFLKLNVCPDELAGGRGVGRAPSVSLGPTQTQTRWGCTMLVLLIDSVLIMDLIQEDVAMVVRPLRPGRFAVVHRSWNKVN
jgi:hypothetical protein